MRSGVVVASRRAEIEAEIDRLIAFLDAEDGDPDMEPEPLEPYFADCKGENDEREDDGDEEPSLGSTASIDHARAWKRPDECRYGIDGEQGDDTGIGDRDGLDPEGEPWLGWTGWGFCGDTLDRESNGDEGDYSPHW